jgi:hypothetical protein
VKTACTSAADHISEVRRSTFASLPHLPSSWGMESRRAGPLWEPLCCAQIGGLTLATFITLLLVPVLYSIFVLDLKLIRWDLEAPSPTSAQEL